MKLFNKTMLAILGSLALSQASTAEVLRVATEPTFAPFDFVDEKTQEIIGYDIDIMNAIAKAADLEIKFEAMQFDGIIPSVISNTVDLAISGMTKNKAREQVVLFSDPYYVAGQELMVRKGDESKYTAMDKLEGKAVCAQIGSVGANVAEGIKDAVVKNFNTITEAYMELKKSGCDAVVTATPVNQYYLVQTNDTELVHVLESQVNAADLGIISNKNNKELMDKVNFGLKTIRENGEYDKIYQRWFGK